MNSKRKVDVFSAGCPVCEDAVDLVQNLACPSCDVTVLDINDPDVARRAETLGIRSIPAVVVNEKLADCCAGRGVREETLRAEGIGHPL